MSLIPTALDLINLRVHCYNPGTGQAAVNDYGYVIASVAPIGGSVPDWTDLAEAFEELVGPLMLPCLANTCNFSGIEVEDVEPAPYGVTATSVQLAQNGTGGDIAVPDQMCPLIRRRTDIRGPSQRGRTFMPFPPTEFLAADGQLNLAAAGLAYFPLMEGLYGSSAPGTTDVNGIVITSVNATYSLLPSLIHRVPKPSVSTSTALNWVRLERKLGALRKRGDWGKMNPEFVG